MKSMHCACRPNRIARASLVIAAAWFLGCASVNNSRPDASLLRGTNLGAWGLQKDGTLREDFVSNPAQRELARGVIGCVRFPVRQLPDDVLLDLVDKIHSIGAAPLVILSSSDTARAVHVASLLKGKITYVEFGNEDNFFRKWSGGHYAEQWKEAVPKIRAANPGLKIGGPVVSHVGTNGSKFVSDFLAALAGAKTLYPDFVSFHLYSAHGEAMSSEKILRQAAAWGARADWVRAETRRQLGVDLPLAVTEWNWDAVPEKHQDDRDQDAAFMRAFTRTVLDQWRTHGVFLSCQYGYGSGMGGGHLAMVRGSTSKPQFEAFKSYAAGE